MRSWVFHDPPRAIESPDGAFGSVKPTVVMTRLTNRSILDRIPKPSFLVPAVIETLANCQVWGPLIQVVPGEADVFCAQDVRQNGGIVFTSDSDLLLHDLGINGKVSFFGDVLYDHSSGTPTLSTSTFSFYMINNQLGVQQVGGLLRVVYEEISGKLRFVEAVEKAKRGSEDTLTSPDYLNFIREYQIDDCVLDNQLILNTISTLDPRISEIVVQTLVTEKTGLTPDTPGKGEVRGPEMLSMFLPIMMENPGLQSCWTGSTRIREIAYGLLQELSRRHENIIEYRTLEPSSDRGGRQLHIPDSLETTKECVRLMHTIKELQGQLPSSQSHWFTFAILQDVEYSTANGRTSLSATLLSQATSILTDAEEYTWDLIHFASQVQASYYSLRMVKQILHVLAASTDFPEHLQELYKSLASLPPITEWPTVQDIPKLLMKFASKDTLSMTTDMLKIPRIDLKQLEAESSRTQTKKRKQNLDIPIINRKARRRVSPSVNPFAILSQASQE